MSIKTDHVLDAKGLACPMPIVKTKKAMKEVMPGQVIEVQATDKGSLADIQAWAKSSGHQYLGSTEEGEVLKHYLRKSGDAEAKEDKNFPHTVQNEEIIQKLESGEDVVILDVREPAEYTFGHIPGAVSIPLGELEDRMDEISKDKEIYVVCRTGSRSDLASLQMEEKGFKHIKNAVQGMAEWTGPIDKVQK
ncbi:sulfurtransferase TusA family protein [Terribacillus saccharophilus]|uniref:sulfurtransferase TusA family protein n=1 Tax=Terribacillus saccharophilus TaxID=361277 RepID=UPI00398277D5